MFGEDSRRRGGHEAGETGGALRCASSSSSFLTFVVVSQIGAGHRFPAQRSRRRIHPSSLSTIIFSFSVFMSCSVGLVPPAPFTTASDDLRSCWAS